MFSFLEFKFLFYKALGVRFFIFWIICLCFIFIASLNGGLNFKISKKNLFFSFIMFIFLLFLFELFLSFGSYFYFYVSSNSDNPEIEKDAFRILFLGESTTAGDLLVDKGDAYAAQIGNILLQKFPNKKMKSYNKGISGIKADSILRNLNRDLTKYKPRLVILMAGGNEQCFRGNKTHIKNLFYTESKVYRLICFIISVPYTIRPDCELETIYNLEGIIRLIRSCNSEIWFAGYLQPDMRERVNPVLQKIAEKNNITYVGDYPMVDFVANRSLFAYDGWHPNKEGHRIIAEKIVERIIQEGIIDNWRPED